MGEETMNRKALSLILILLLLVPVAYADYLYDSVPTTVGTSSLTLNDNHPANDGYSSYGYYWTPGVNVMLHTVQWQLSKAGNPTVELYTQIYAAVAHKPNGAALATSNVLYGNNLTSTLTLYDFWFNSTERVNLVGGNEYCVVLIAGGGTIDKTTNKIYVRYDGTPLVGDPRLVSYTSGGGGQWSSDSSKSPVFYAYAYNASAPVIEDYEKIGSSGDSSEFQVNITVQDDNEYVNLNTVDFSFNVSDDSQYFTLRWTQVTDTFSEVSDVGGICTLNDGYSTVIDYQTIKLTFEFTVASTAVNGTAAIVVTATDDDALTDVENYVNYVTGWSWDEVGDIIDSAFEFFGIVNYMTSITSFITSLAGYLAESLTNIVDLIYQQFRLIRVIFATLIYWYGAFLGTLLNFITFVQDIVNGVSSYYNQLGSLWVWIGWSTWAPAMPLFLFIWWIDSVDKRASQTVGGWIQVLVNDFNTAMNIMSYFLSVFSYVVNNVIDRAYSILYAL